MKKNRKKLIRIIAAALCLSMLCACEKPVTQGPSQNGQKDVSGKYYLDNKSGEAIIDDVNTEKLVAAADDNNNRVFYEIFVGAFSDSNGDGIGDLRGLIERFDYLNDGDPKSGKSLGVEGIWLMPIFKSGSYHKYDIDDYYTIDPKYGTMDDLRELTKLCHERGVKLIIDMVINHTSLQNEWFVKFAEAQKNNDTANVYYDFYTNSATKPSGNRAFYKISGASGYYEGNFSSDMPELNFDNEKVRQAVLDVAKFYLTDVGLDGFRFDAAKYVYFGDEPKNVEFWQWYVDSLRAIKPNVYTVAEVWDSDSITSKYLPAVNCFSFQSAQTDGLISQAAKTGNVTAYTRYAANFVTEARKVRSDATLVPFIANHDTDRAAGYLSVNEGYAYAAANVYLLGPGSPFIYYGEEIGMKGSRGTAGTDSNRRLAMLWGDDDPVQDPEGTTYSKDLQINGTVYKQAMDGDSLFNHYKRLIMVRKANPEIGLGTCVSIDNSKNKLGGFVYEYNGSKVAVVHNTTKTELSINLSDIKEGTFTVLYDVVGNGGATLEEGRLTIYGQTSVILR